MIRKLFIEHLEDRRVLAADFNGDDTVDSIDLDRWRGGFGTTGTAAVSQGDADGDMDVDGNDFLNWQRGLGPTRHQLIAYRPQFVQDDTPIPAPRYQPLVKTPVREADEMSNTLGPGIRINWDDDNNNGTADVFDAAGTSSRENDLIEVKVESTNGLNLALVLGSPLKLYYDFDKEIPIPMNNGMTEDLPFFGTEITVWVEWTANTHGLANLSLVNSQTSVTQDTVRFHSFRSLIVVFGGNTQDPRDTDGDGSIGDRVEPDSANREGIFDVAQELYETGWDVLPFDEEEVDDAPDIPFTEIVNAHENRFIEAHAIMGFSQGGGATHDLIERLYAEEDILTRIGIYLDAVDHDGAFAENDWPDVAFYLLNIYQQNPESTFFGGDVDDNEVVPGAILEELNVTTDYNPNITHFSIDDDPLIQDLIKDRLQDYLIFR